MKKLALTFIFILTAIVLMAQVPAGFSYQAVVRNNSGEVVANQTVKFKFSILQNSETGTPVYVETQSKETNAFGLTNLVVGSGTVVSGNFNPASWGNNSHFLKVELDPANGNTFVHLGTMQLMAVPYAFHAQTVGEIADNSVTSAKIASNAVTEAKIASGAVTGSKIAQSGATPGQALKWNGTTWAPATDETGSGGSNPTGPAGGDLSGTYPNPTIGSGKVTETKIASGAVTAAKLASMGATAEQVLSWNGTAWAPKSLTDNLWLKSGSDIYFNAGKVAIGKIPGADLRQFQVLTSDRQAVAAVNNSATYASIYAVNEGTGPAAEFRSKIKIMDGTQGAGKVLTSDAGGFASWQTPASNTWQKVGDDLFYTAGYVGIGTTATNYPLTIENASNTSYIKLKDNQGIGGMRIGAFNGELAFINDNVNKNIRFSINSGAGYFQVMTIDATNKRVGINTSTPSASLDVEGTMAVGSDGKVFSEIREITGTTNTSGGSITISYPSGYNMSNIRVLSLEINYRGNSWIGLGGNQQNSSINERIFYYLGTSIMIYYPPVSDFQNKAFRIMVMKVN